MIRIRNLHNRSVGAFVRAVADIGDNVWSGPTPCEGWSVRDLLAHVVAEELWEPPLLAGRTIAEVGDRFEGDVLGADPVGAARAAAASAVEAVERVDLAMTVHLSFGDFPAEFYLEQVFADHVVHTWDLCAATGIRYPAGDDIIEACTTWFEQHEQAYRASGAIGDRPAAVPDAGLERLLIMFGRDPGWTP